MKRKDDKKPEEKVSTFKAIKDLLFMPADEKAELEAHYQEQEEMKRRHVPGRAPK